MRSQALRERYADLVRGGHHLRARLLGRRLSLTRAEIRAHLRGIQEWNDKHPPTPFESFAALAPGSFDPRVLQQTTWWVDILRRPHRITSREDFPDDHLLAVIAMLRREAWRWAPMPDLDIEAASGLGAAAVVHEVQQAYVAAMEGTPLMKALRAEAAKRRIEAQG